MKTFHQTEIPVLWSHLDSNHHVNNAIFQFYFDEARMQALESTGFNLAELRKINVGPVIYKSEIEYKKPLYHPETAIIQTWFEGLEKVRGITCQNLYRKSDGELVCKARFYSIFFDLEKDKPWKIPLELGENLRELSGPSKNTLAA
ncbi:MAG TPA: acyl-CoA thioesterase [Leptospiraceae bacterium]|nr:acyl-CoA thioesterase [Leptospiraceae bacterium]HMW06724.1 acyl-CoA thioesterase [Leptospiraceae bacterium]HMX33533.1 acyl-CoA thioesterase [Leptospiraceae bacterium]HMY32030.1 acyl-CoA thioesterase [Leptospiraceae bacterium]HMZ67025.1 acyl-CoA thioesterase [Leptospiraceae bacterium]